MKGKFSRLSCMILWLLWIEWSEESEWGDTHAQTDRKKIHSIQSRTPSGIQLLFGGFKNIYLKHLFHTHTHSLVHHKIMASLTCHVFYISRRCWMAASVLNVEMAVNSNLVVDGRESADVEKKMWRNVGQRERERERIEKRVGRLIRKNLYFFHTEDIYQLSWAEW